MCFKLLQPILLCCFALLTPFLAFTSLGQDGKWTAGLPPITARALGAAATVAGKVYMVGGGNYSCGVTPALQAYDPVANSWTNLPNMPTARYEFGATELDGQLYAIAGNPGCGSAAGAIRAVEVFDPLANSWSTRAPLPSGSWDPSVTSVNGKIYVIGGFGNTVYAYDPIANSWSTNPPSPQNFSAGASVVVDGIIYLLGGSQGSQAAVQAYNPATHTWTTRTSMPTPRSSCAGAALNGLIYVIGGLTSTGAVSTVEAYDPAADTWSTVTALPYRVWAASAATLNGILYFMGGFDISNNTIGTVVSLHAHNLHRLYLNVCRSNAHRPRRLDQPHRLQKRFGRHQLDRFVLPGAPRQPLPFHRHQFPRHRQTLLPRHAAVSWFPGSTTILLLDLAFALLSFPDRAGGRFDGTESPLFTPALPAESPAARSADRPGTPACRG